VISTEAKRDSYFVATGPNNINIRKKPSNFDCIKDKLPPGTNGLKIVPNVPIDIDNSGKTFVKVHYGSKMGWVWIQSLFIDKRIEYFPPENVKYTLDGESKSLSPRKYWSMVSPNNSDENRYTGMPVTKKIDGQQRYRVAVGPKVLRPSIQWLNIQWLNPFEGNRPIVYEESYPDGGKIQDDEFQGFSRNINVYLRHKTTNKMEELACIVDDFKEYTFGTFGNNADNIKGYVQTGIPYPELNKEPEPEPEHSDGSIIEFCTDEATLEEYFRNHKPGFNPSEYFLEKIVVYKRNQLSK